MKAKNVVILNEAADDLDDGRLFYDEKETGVGDYFWDSLVADIESLTIRRRTQQKVWLSSNAG